MRIRSLALAIAAAGILAVGLAAPAPAQEIKKFEGTIAAPLPAVSNALAGDYSGADQARITCPDPGDGDGVVYKFFEFKGDFKHFFISGPASTLNEPDPSGVNGTFHDYDLDFYAFNAKCEQVDVDGDINLANGIGPATAARPARFGAVAYFSGPHPNIAVTVEASNAPIKKK